MQWLMMQQDEPDDFVIATGEQYSVREFIEAAALHLDMHIRWEGEGIHEKGIDTDTGQTMVEVDPHYFRPTEVQDLLGDPTKARQKLGWKPRISFRELVAEMIEADLTDARKDYFCQQEGFQTFNHTEI